MPFFTLLFGLALLLSNFTLGDFNQVPGEGRETPLFQTLKTRDSLLFELGFNQCRLAVFDSLVAEDFEFYHDQSGLTPSKAAFMEGTREGLCKLDYQPIRKLDASSLRVFPLRNNGVLYGGIQTGSHSFYARYEGEEELELTSTAVFTHLWIKKEQGYQLARVLSYDHHSPGN